MILVGVVWVIFWAIDNIGAPLPAQMKTVVKVVVSIIGLIFLLSMLMGSGVSAPVFPR